MSFCYQEGQLGLQQKGQWMPLSQLTNDQEEAFYIYDLDGIADRFAVLKAELPKNISIHYAMKANDHPEILKFFASQGAGADIVSGGELEAALEAGFSADKIIFSGVGKSKKEIALAIEKGVRQINVESLPELLRIAELGRKAGQRVPVAARLNPDVNPDTHPYIKTGFRENKFGLDKSELSAFAEIVSNHSESLSWVGLTMHIGSQIRELKPFLDATQITIETFSDYKSKGFDLVSLDIGGGLGMNYDRGDLAEDETLISEYGTELKKALEGFDGEILCEPGRVLVGRFGMLLGQVEYIKETPYKSFVIVNTGMHHILRPALYQAHHRILNLQDSGEDKKLFDVVGPICESTDVLGHDRMLSPVKEGDWLAVADTGAYCAVMATTYNGHGLPAQIVVSGGKAI